MQYTFNYATCPNRASAQCEIFGANTRCAGTAPTFTLASDHDVFSADFIREVDNLIQHPEIISPILEWISANLFQN